MTISPSSLALLTRRLSDLTGGGLTLSRSLAVLTEQSEDRAVRDLLASLHSDLAKGKCFSEAITNQNGTFPPSYVGLVRAGEASGSVEATLDELAALLENDVDARRRVQTALAYPAVLLLLAIGVCFFLTVFVVPRFEFLFDDLGQRLPLPTRLLIGFTVAVKKFGLFAVIGTAAAGYGVIKKKPAWVSECRKKMVRLPLLSDVLRGAALQRWSQTMASLLRGGLPVSEAMAVSRKMIDGPLFGTEVETALGRVKEGQGLSAALTSSPFFPPMMCELIAAAEESGRLDQTFERLGQAYKRETELKVKLALSMLEPALVVAMGVIVGFVAVAMLVPIFEMSANIR